jgi:hypothetical protein
MRPKVLTIVSNAENIENHNIRIKQKTGKDKMLFKRYSKYRIIMTDAEWYYLSFIISNTNIRRK